MPNAPKTPTRTFRVEDGVWVAAQKKAAREKKTLTSILIQALKDYVTKED